MDTKTIDRSGRNRDLQRGRVLRLRLALRLGRGVADLLEQLAGRGGALGTPGGSLGEQPQDDLVEGRGDGGIVTRRRDRVGVQVAADDLEWESAADAGIRATPGSAERVALEMSGAERRELERLIEAEINQTGA